MKSTLKSFLIALIAVSATFSFTNAAYGQKSKKPAKNKQEQKSDKKVSGIKYASADVVAAVGDEQITFAELEKAYKKNLNRKDIKLNEVSADSVNEFLNLYVNFRLKVQDAISRGFDQDSSIQAEIGRNRKILAESYYFDKRLTEPNVNRMLEMRKVEKQIAYILIAFPPSPTPDTTQAWAKAKSCMELIRKGHDFEKIAHDSSEDKETAAQGGVLSRWLTAGFVQKPIEKAVYGAKPGEVYPEIISTRYGYFIIKVLREEPRKKIRCDHILLAWGDVRDTLGLTKKADSLLALIRGGADFGKLAKENSDDKASAVNGGYLGAWYSRTTGLEGTGRELNLEFSNALYNLFDGQVSGKVLSDYGIHIIKRDSSKIINPESEREDVKKLYKRVYLEMDKREFFDEMKKSLNFKIHEDGMTYLLESVDTTKTNLDTAWVNNIPANIKSKTLYSFMKKPVTISEFISLTKSKNELRGLGLNREGITRGIDRLVDPLAFDEATKNLETDYPEFSVLIKEFRDGILLFKVESIEVWDKLKFDTLLAKSYWDTTKTRYMTAPVYDISEIFVLSDSLAKDIYSQLKAGADFASLAEKNTQRSGYREKKGNFGRVNEKDNKLAKLVVEKKIAVGTYSEPISNEKGYSIIKVNGYEPVRQKTFEEAITDFATHVQDILQKSLSEKWLSELRTKIPVEIYKDNLNRILDKK